jgi:NADH dehydrogenase/NADH:ubiquinone oxidoreductase subunit G
MPDSITLMIDEKEVSVPEGTTILKAAEQAGIHIPTICFHDHCTANALCRICVVEVEGARVLVPSCIGTVSQGMVVTTKNERINKVRRTILEMMQSSNDLSDAPEIQQMMIEYDADPDRFSGSKRREPPVIDDNPMYIRDYAKCILCWRCVQVCATDAQYAFAINFCGRGYETQISTFFDTPMPQSTCVFCGQCVGVCPTGALKPKREWLTELGRTPDEILSLTRSERQSKRRRSDATV